MVQGEIGMKISACVIVKNEANNIAQWLENMQAIADDIVVVDTGSEDNTVEIVRSYGVEPYYFKWCSDFAAAKNYALEQAKGDWILFLDADEYFTPASIQKFREVLGKYHRNKKIGAIMCRLINIDRDDMDRLLDDMLQVRIFRRTRSIRYVGAVHEQIHTDSKYTMQFCKDLEIYHTGYSSSLMAQKTERNLPILEKMEREAKTTKERECLYVYLIDAYNSLGQHEKVLEYAKLAVESDVNVVGDATRAHKAVISALIKLGRDSEEIMAAIDEALEKFPEDTFFLVEKGYFYYAEKSYLKAQSYFEDAIRSHKQLEKKLADGIGTTDSALSILPWLYGELADIYLLQGKEKQAEELAIKGLSYHRYNRLLTRCLYKSLAHKDLVEIVQKFNGIYDKIKDGDYLIDTLSDLCQPHFAAYYGRSCQQDMNKLKAFLRTDNYSGAAALAGRNLQIYEKFFALAKQARQ